jgi:hypothetical protein
MPSLGTSVEPETGIQGSNGNSYKLPFLVLLDELTTTKKFRHREMSKSAK